LSVDWKILGTAFQQSRDGNHLKAISTLSALLSEAESNSDRAAILLGQSSFYSRAGNTAKSWELLESAKMRAQEDRVLLSQVAMSEGSLYAQNDQLDLACEKFASVKSEYKDVLARPENDDFAVELDSRLACALYEAGKNVEAIQLFEGLFKREKLEDKQRLEVFFCFRADTDCSTHGSTASSFRRDDWQRPYLGSNRVRLSVKNRKNVIKGVGLVTATFKFRS